MQPRSALVVGGGVMGGGIAQTLAVAGLDVCCVDVDDAAIERARTNIIDGRYGLARAVERNKLTAETADAARSRLTFSTDAVAGATAADLVIEAIPEDLAMKQDLFRQLDAAAPPHAVFATNTSGLSVAAMAGATQRPTQVIGWHWASPAQIMALAEVIVTAETSRETIDTVTILAERCGKNVVLVKDNPATWGHVGNRIYFAMVREAQAVIAEGLTDAAGVDRIMVDGFNWPVGPFGMAKGAGSGWSA